MTVESVLAHGLKTSVFGSQWNAEHGDNLALLDPDRIKSDTLANRPAAGVAHRFFFATDNQKLYYDTGATWVDITAVALAHAASHASGGADAVTLAQSQVTNLAADLAGKEPANANIQTHIASAANPHAVTKAHVGLGNADNTSDAAKPVSTAAQTALDLKANDNAVPHLTGNENIGGVKTFTSNPVFQFNIRDQFRGLLVNNNAVTPNTKIDYSFTEGALQDSSGNPVLCSNATGTIDMATQGADGRSEAAAQTTGWYYLWAVWNGTNIKAVCGLSATTITTMPAGYTHKALMGAVYSTAAVFKGFKQRQNCVVVNEATAGSSSSSTAAGGAITVADGTVSYCPSIAKAAHGLVYATNSANGIYINLNLASDIAAGTKGYQFYAGYIPTANTTYIGGSYRISLIGSSLYLWSDIANTTCTLQISGWEY